MSQYSEEEQLQSLKHFWEDYGNAVMVAAIVILAAFTGWRYWNMQQAKVAQESSGAYQHVLEDFQRIQNVTEPNADTTALQRDAHALMTNHPESVYAQMSGLLLARRAVDVGDMKEAEKQLRWVVEQKPVEEIRIMANLRLARVLLAKGDAKGALALLDKIDNAGFAPSVQEMRGDALLADKRPDEARQAYTKARDALVAAKLPRRPILEVKMADLGVKPVIDAADSAVGAVAP